VLISFTFASNGLACTTYMRSWVDFDYVNVALVPMFLFTMLLFGLVPSWWALLAVPAAVLIGFTFASIGLACTTYMRSWVDFDYVNLALVPMFLFSATFFPISQYPAGLQAVIRVTPLYQGVVLVRGLVLGQVEWFMLVHVAYLVIAGAIGLRIAARRIVRLLQP